MLSIVGKWRRGWDSAAFHGFIASKIEKWLLSDLAKDSITSRKRTVQLIHSAAIHPRNVQEIQGSIGIEESHTMSVRVGTVFPPGATRGVQGVPRSSHTRPPTSGGWFSFLLPINETPRQVGLMADNQTKAEHVVAIFIVGLHNESLYNSFNLICKTEGTFGRLK